MSRLIDADEFIKDAYPLEGVPLERVKNAPTVDAVPVVRCKDCKYRTWFAPYYGCGNFESPFYSAVDGDVAIMTKPNDFCSYGERRLKDEVVQRVRK